MPPQPDAPAIDRPPRRPRGGAGAGLALAIVAIAAGCAALEPPAGRGASRAPADEPWENAITDFGGFVVTPPSEDVVLGDVFLFPAAPIAGERRDVSGIADLLRWRTLDLEDVAREDGRTRANLEGTGAGEDRADPGSSVALRIASRVEVEPADIEAWLPLEAMALIDLPASAEGLSMGVQFGDAAVESVPARPVLDSLLARPTEALRLTPLLADRVSGLAYVAVVTEVLRARTIEVTLRAPGSSDGSGPRGVEAIQRANELNAALRRAGDRDSGVEFVAVAEDAITFRRRWPAPLALAVRGLTVEVDAESGTVLRSGPLGEPLPGDVLEVAQEEGEESEVLEERRRGRAKIEDLFPEDFLRPRLSWDYGPRLDALGGDLTVLAGGRIHYDVSGFSDDDELRDAFGSPEGGSKVRRAFLELGGVYRRLDFNFWVNFSDVDLLAEGRDFGYADFRNVFVGVRDVPVVGGIRAGYFKEPFGLEEITSSNDITFLERSLTDAFIERRNLGVMFQRRFTENGDVTAAVGFYRNATNDLDVKSGYGLTGRLTTAALRSDDERKVVHLGSSLTLRRPDDDLLRFSSRGSSAQGQVLADTGLFAADREMRWGVEFGTVSNSWSFQTETIVALSDAGGAVTDRAFWGTYLMGSYVLTGEHRTYRERVGAFGTVVPTRSIREGGIGAFELSGRYAYLDLDSADVSGGRLHDWTLGINWYAQANVRLMLGAVLAHPEGFGFQRTGQLRLQVSL
ncbi:MAG: porin [Planctomycetota bacterium]